MRTVEVVRGHLLSVVAVLAVAGRRLRAFLSSRLPYKVLTVVTTRPWNWPRVFIAYGPGLVLIDDAHWRNWRAYAGFGFRRRHAVTWVMFR